MENVSRTLKYHYQYKDHLGNVRLSYTDANQNNTNPVSLQIIQEKNYYPFRLSHKGYNDATNGYGNSAAKMFKFGGKEYQDEESGGKNLDWYDFHARNYDAALGRWMNVDPLAEEFYEWSTYIYTYNNPLNFVDPTGMGPEDIRIWGKDDNDNDVLVLNLVTDEVNADIRTDIKVPKGVEFASGHDPITNKQNENASGALIEYDIDKFFPEFLSDIPKGDNGILSIGMEASFIKGYSSSIDLTFFFRRKEEPWMV